ncbi:MAG TPA: 2Fe-2S iron-sulfur cluster-binding protein, partial [Bacteroidota bacterium]|nr:2Fe-2S iron-sulfur cluster-binding protein [Bacteroidota bacterium]
MTDNAFNNKTSNSQQTSNNGGQVSGNNGKTVDIEIDGRKYNVPYGISILQACRMQKINIPTLCFHPDLCVTGSCRICLVEIEGMRTLQASCSYSITQPIKIHTTSEKVRKARRTILDLMISDHYGECYTCERNGNCQLQKLAKEYGVDYYRFGHV